ncbi:hypothetical protein PspLS_11775 [Pyricularia sp. CBS 133598]|nr:hypothetical protein PspLS_11775 [Pyricularia sp. CBS 133598]
MAHTLTESTRATPIYPVPKANPRTQAPVCAAIYALVMITKAGDPAKKVYLGEWDYGHSFKLAEAGCKGLDCMFFGDRLHSQASSCPRIDTLG